MSEREDNTQYVDGLRRLTPLELQVLAHRCTDKTSQEIAELMSISPELARLLLADIYDRLGIAWEDAASSLAMLSLYCPYVSEVAAAETSPDAGASPPPEPSHRALELVDENDEALRAQSAAAAEQTAETTADGQVPAGAPENAAYYVQVLQRLHPAELDMLRYRCAGRTSDEIAALMSIPDATARHLLADIYDKLGLTWQQETTSLAALNRFCPYVAQVAPEGAAATPFPVPQPLPPQPSLRAFQLVTED